MTAPVVWSIAGTDSSGGAGLAADQRAVEAFAGVHLCTVVTAVTAQSSRAVTHIEPLSIETLDAQFRALESDMPPAALKTGLLAGAQQVRCVARWVDRLRERRPSLALVVDPVLGASSGAAFADAQALAAYRDELLPRATLVTPNRREACALLGSSDDRAPAQPDLARRLRALGAMTACITGGDARDAPELALDWLDSDHARGWLALDRIATHNDHGTGCSFAAGAAAALALGFVPADAAVLAKMATAQALRHGHAAGHGNGQVGPAHGFAADPSLMPRLSWGESACFEPASGARAAQPGLYAIVDSAERVRAVLRSGVRTVQLRIKAPAQADKAWQRRLRDAVRSSVAEARRAGATLFINDHWRLALECGAAGVHLGQDDLLGLDDAERAELRASGLALGVSSHSLWELARARSIAPDYIACGPVWPTLTKAMPWRAQGLHNLRWWCAMAGTPVVAIGGVLETTQITDAARAGAAGVCVLRMLGDAPAETVPAMLRAFESADGGHARLPAEALPHPSLAGA